VCIVEGVNSELQNAASMPDMYQDCDRSGCNLRAAHTRFGGAGKQETRITLAVGSFHGSGAERMMVTLANKLIERGHGVDIVVGRDVGPYPQLLSRSVTKVVLSERVMVK